jgi:hypothetical protein
LCSFLNINEMRKSIFLMLITTLLVGCKEDNKSNKTEILDFSVTTEDISNLDLDTILIDSIAFTITLVSHGSLPDNGYSIVITPEIEVSAGAYITPLSGTSVTFSDRDEVFSYLVTAEDGTHAEWYVALRDKQLPNSGFEDWYTTTGMNGHPFTDPGKSKETTVWATANMGTSTYGVYSTQDSIEGENTLVIITTDATSIVPVAAGTLFTGRFDVAGAIAHPSDPQKATLFGIPFWFRPTAMKIEYKYQSGDSCVQATLNNPNNIFGGFTLSDSLGRDSCTIYSIIEAREGDLITVLGRADFVASTTEDSTMHEQIIPYLYTSSNKNPTHITVVFSSSKDGDLYTGAVGSTLVVDNLELLY